MPELSIIIPYYNQPEDLEIALRSITLQTFKDLEVIVVDDASRKGCSEIVQNFKQENLDISLLIQEQRRYTMHARIRGIEAAKGKYVTFIDADDLLDDPQGYEVVLQKAVRDKADVVHFLTSSVGDSQELVHKPALPFGSDLRQSDIFETWLKRGCPAHTVWCKIYSRELCAKVSAVAKDMLIYRAEDFFLTILFMFFAQKYVSCHVNLYKYNLPGARHEKKLMGRSHDMFYMYRELPDVLEKYGIESDHKERLRSYIKKLLVVNVGRLCHFVHCNFTNEDKVSPEVFELINEYSNFSDMIMAVAFANASNAARLKCSGSFL